MVFERISGFSDEISQDIKTQFEVLSKLGMRYFEVRGVNGKNISLLSDEEVLKLKQQMEEYGIKASAIGSPIGKIRINENFDEHIKTLKRIIWIAKILDCNYIRIFSFYQAGDEWTNEERNEVFRRLKIMIEIAKKENIILLHENEKGIYGDTADKCLELFMQYGCEHFGAVFDPANFVQCGQDTKAAFKILKPYIRYVHIKDANAEDGKVVPAGLGNGNIEVILQNLFKNGYEGFISLEPHLGSFEGLADLELGDEMKDLPKGGEGTFTIAYHALYDILNRIVM